MNTADARAAPGLHNAVDLRPRVRGSVLLPGDDGYAAGSSGHNTALVHRPAVVVTADGDDDVREAVRFAARHGLPIAVHATGHGQAVPTDGAVLVNTAQMNEVRVDPVSRTARIGAGARWEQVIDAAFGFGLAPPSGSAPRVGAVGYTLGGGLGPLGRSRGYAADNVRSFEVVTADGVARTASAEEHPDLFWALRGGKGNFGVVTSMVIGLFPVPRLYGGGLFFPGEKAADILHAYRRWTAALPEEMTSSVALTRFPPVPEVPGEVRGRFAVHLRVAYCGPEEQGRRLLEPMRLAGPPLLDTVQDMPFTDVGTINGDPTEPGPYYERSTVLDGLGPEVVDVLLDHAGPGTDSPLAVVELRHLGGALARPPEPGNAVGNRNRGFTVFTAGVPEPDARAVQRHQERLVAALAPWGSGGPFLCFQSADESTPDHVRAAYEPETFERLVRVKRDYDPRDVFRLTHRISARS